MQPKNGCTVSENRASASHIRSLIVASDGGCVSGSVERLRFRQTDMTRRETDPSKAITGQFLAGETRAFRARYCC